MGQFSMEISGCAGSALSGNQHPKADPIDTATGFLAENLAKFGEQAPALTAHAKSAMLSKLDELREDVGPVEPTAPSKVVRGVPLAVWAFIFAQVIDATEEPGETRPHTARVTRRMSYDELMFKFIEGEVSGSAQQREHFLEYCDLIRAELLKFRPRDGDILTEIFSFFGMAK